MRRCAIMQPTYLPWSGYFNLMMSVDVFVLLDDVQFERRSWQSRNRILLQGKEHMLTVPVKKTAREAPVSAIELHTEQDWRKQHMQVLNHAYARHPFGRPVLSLIEGVFAQGHTHLADLNQALIEGFAGMLGIDTPLKRASTLGCGGQRSDHLAEICRAIECSAYLSPAGSHDYMVEDRFEERHGIHAAFQQFQPATYDQIGADTFVSHLSIVDVIAHKGPEAAKAYISGAAA